jgi:hypothetical protein
VGERGFTSTTSVQGVLYVFLVVLSVFCAIFLFFMHVFVKKSEKVEYCVFAKVCDQVECHYIKTIVNYFHWLCLSCLQIEFAADILEDLRI